MDEHQLRDLKVKVADSVQDAAKFLYQIFAPHWNARTDALKTLVSVSSGSIVLTVAFASSISSLNRGLLWRYLALSAFTMFAVSVISGLVAIWIGVGLHELESDFVNERARLQATVDLVDKNSKDLSEPFSPVINEMLKPLASRDKWADRFSNVSFVAFILAILSLAVIGFKQLLP